jgi:hypothetical protein
MVRRNETAGRLLKALCLLARYFPEACEEYNNMSIWQARTKWMDIMLKFYQLVDNAFFKVDWRLIELAQRNWTEAKGSAESEKLLALFLKYIPFLTFGFTMADTFVCPPIKLLSNFLHTMPRNFHMPVSALVGLIPDINQEAYSGLLWDSQANRHAWARVKAIKRNPEAWPEPIRYLPQFANWALCRTNNTILSLPADAEHPWPWEVLDNEAEWFTWDEHFALITRDWQRARPIIVAFKDFLAWGERPEHLTWLIEFFINGKGSDTVPSISSEYSNTHHETNALSLMNYTGDEIVFALPVTISVREASPDGHDSGLY